MNRTWITLALVSLIAGCGQQTAQPNKTSAPPAYVAPATTSNEASVEDRHDADQDAVAGADLDAPSGSLPTSRDNRSVAADEEMARDDSQPDDVTGDSGANLSHPDTSETVQDEPAPADDDNADRADTAVSQKRSAGKLLRGLANSVSRAVAKSYRKRTILPPPVEGDPFPNGEPEDADPDLNR